jgi:undecaprenyl-diphosphatase
MFEQLNLALFSALNAHANLSGWQLMSARFAAEWLILLVPLSLAALWIGGAAGQREAAVRAGFAVTAALAINAVIGVAWFHPRPFMAGVGHTFMHHAPDSSFPSDHATIMLTVAMALATSAAGNARRLGTLMMPVAIVVAWSRVYLGVHYPMDMVGALAVSLFIVALFNTRPATAACATVVPAMENIYRRVLAMPIARGWIRP